MYSLLHRAYQLVGMVKPHFILFVALSAFMITISLGPRKDDLASLGPLTSPFGFDHLDFV